VLPLTTGVTLRNSLFSVRNETRAFGVVCSTRRVDIFPWRSHSPTGYKATVGRGQWLFIYQTSSSLPPGMTNNEALLAASLCAATSLALIWRWQKNRSRLPYPPGPKGYPLIGNVLDVPQDVPVWKTFIDLAQKSGKYPLYLAENRPTEILSIQDTDVLYLRLVTQDFVVLSSTEAIIDLSEKRSNIICDRVSPLVRSTS